MGESQELMKKIDGIHEKLDTLIKISLLRAVYPKAKLDIYDVETLQDLIGIGVQQDVITVLQELITKWEAE